MLVNILIALCIGLILVIIEKIILCIFNEDKTSHLIYNMLGKLLCAIIVATIVFYMDKTILLIPGFLVYSLYGVIESLIKLKKVSKDEEI